MCCKVPVCRFCLLFIYQVNCINFVRVYLLLLLYYNEITRPRMELRSVRREEKNKSNLTRSIISLHPFPTVAVNSKMKFNFIFQIQKNRVLEHGLPLVFQHC
jgi:hypothetical protein